jgi:hypothetical protein
MFTPVIPIHPKAGADIPRSTVAERDNMGTISPFVQPNTADKTHIEQDTPKGAQM